MIDSHCHLADEVFAADAAQVIGRARDAGVEQALCILDAGSADEAARVPGLLDLWPAIRFSAGIHPHQAGTYAATADDVPRIVGAAIDGNPHVRALGEIGLDYHYDFAPRDVQQAVFRTQVRVARERDLPVIIHTREADEDTVRILTEEGEGRVRGVFHCFTGDEALARAALGLGFHVSFSGIVTFPRAEALRAVVPLVPDDRLLIETDSPFLAPVPFRGKRNEPAWVGRVAETLASLRSLSVDDIKRQTMENFRRLFRP